MLHLIIDMGTSNTRLYLIRDGKETAQSALSFGARATAEQGQETLYRLLREKIAGLIGGTDEPLDEIFVYGMGGSECGIVLTERVDAPADVQKLYGGINQVRIPALWDAPVSVIPGVRCRNEEEGIAEIMRGEETETVGFLTQYPDAGECILILPGSHCKTIRIGAAGEIRWFSSALSGEMLQAMAENTILKTAVRLGEPTDGDYLRRGAAASRRSGTNCALLQIRTMQVDGVCSAAQMTSFFLGAVLYPEIEAIAARCGNQPVYVGGKPSLQEVYCALLRDAGVRQVIAVENAARLGLRGALEIVRYRGAQQEKEALIGEIRAKKIITIIRGLRPEDYVPTVQALYDGGIRFVEVTYDASGKQSDEETAAIIRTLAERFAGKVNIGAGSVLKPSQVRLTAESGGKYIISPNFDPAVVAETNRLSLVSIPGCLTPSEIVNAYNHGADFVKVFPNDLGKQKYITAVHAPLPHIPLLAVGSVDETNLQDMLRAGAVGVGIGSLLIDKKAIAGRRFELLTERAVLCCRLIEETE